MSVHRRRATRARTTSHRVAAATVLALVVGSALGALPAFAGENVWTPASSTPRGARVISLRPGTESGHVVGSLSFDGVYETTNTGQMWTPVAADWDLGGYRYATDAVYAFDGSLIAATSKGMTRLSADATSWPVTGNIPQLTGSAYTSVGRAYTGTLVTGASTWWRSVDHGSTWVTATTAPAFAMTAFDCDATTLFAGTWSAGAYTSVDDGVNWTAIAALPANLNVYAVRVAGARVYVAATSGLWRSIDGGATWAQVSDKWCYDVADMAGTMYIAVGGEGVFASDDGGANWTAAAGGLPGDSVQELHVSAGQLLAGFSGSGVFARRSSAGGFEYANEGLVPLVLTQSTHTKDGSIFALTEQPDGSPAGTFRSADEGATWQAVTGLWDSAPIRLLHSWQDRAFAGNGAGLWRTSDGASWATWPPTGSDPYSVAVSPDGDTTVIGQYDQVSIAHEGDGVWTYLTATGLLLANGIDAAAVSNDGDIAVAGLGQPTVRSLSNGAGAWADAAAATGTSAKHLATAPDGRIYLTGLGALGAQVSTDDGKTFAAVTGWPAENCGRIVSSESGDMFTVMSDGGVYRSTDSGSTWVCLSASDGRTMALACSGDGALLVRSTAAGLEAMSLVAPTLMASVIDTSTLGEIEGWHGSPVALRLVRGATGTTWYRTDSGSWESSTDTTVAVPSTEGSHTISYFSASEIATGSPESMQIRVDTTAPTEASIRINGGATSTSSRAITVSLAATDNVGGSGIKYMQIDSGSGWDYIRAFADTSAATVPGYDGAKVVRVRIGDLAENWIETSATITFKRPAPTMAKPTVSPSTPRKGKSFTIKGTITQRVGGKTRIYLYRKGSKGYTIKVGSWLVSNYVASGKTTYRKTLSVSRRVSYRAYAIYQGGESYAPKKSAYRYFSVK
ncbi:MAG: hypothetical protein HGB10_08420 [Coriobacteriia bacterium]|nr:hypothetical protein [Coriobacteriia bacterium]